MTSDLFKGFTADAVGFKKTDDPDYKPRRKTLASAFFKSKLQFIVQTIKEETLKELSRRADKNTMDICKFFSYL